MQTWKHIGDILRAVHCKVAHQKMLMAFATFPFTDNKLQTTSGTTLKVCMNSVCCNLCSIFTLCDTAQHINHYSKNFLCTCLQPLDTEHMVPLEGNIYKCMPCALWHLHSIFCFATFLACQKIVAIRNGSRICVYAHASILYLFSVLLLIITSPAAEPRNIGCKAKLWKNCKGDLF
jgi:hypothetical protein